jgi:hypothetical protein
VWLPALLLIERKRGPFSGTLEVFETLFSGWEGPSEDKREREKEWVRWGMVRKGTGRCQSGAQNKENLADLLSPLNKSWVSKGVLTLFASGHISWHQAACEQSLSES